MKALKDYLHLYLGCELYQQGGYPIKLTGSNYDYIINHNHEYGKAILRPLSDMTEEEKKHLLVNCLNEPYMYASGTFSISKSGYIGISQESGYVNFCTNVTAFHYLLSIGIDLFGLIESGLAIDKTKRVIEGL